MDGDSRRIVDDSMWTVVELRCNKGWFTEISAKNREGDGNQSSESLVKDECPVRTQSCTDTVGLSE